MTTNKLRIPLILGIIAALLLTGTLVYSKLEGWSLIDSFYFTGVTMTTVGYGDIAPTKDFTKIFTVPFALVSVAFGLYLLFQLASISLERRYELMEMLNRISVKKERTRGNNKNTLFKKKFKGPKKFKITR